MPNTEHGDKKKQIEEYYYSPHLYLKGWKAIGAYIGVHPQTVRKWHYTVLRLPYGKTSGARQGKVIVAKPIVQTWVEYLRKTRALKDATVKIPREEIEGAISDRYGIADPTQYAI